MRLPRAHPQRRPPAAGLLQRGGLPARTPRAPLPRCCCVPIPRRSLHPSCSPIPRRWLMPVARTVRLAEPSPVLLAMLLQLVLARRWLRPRRLEAWPRLPHVTSAYFKCFQMFRRYVSSVLCERCKSRSGCCICCNDCTHMLQVSVPNVLAAFLYECCKCVHLDVACVSHICCKCFFSGYCICLQCFSCVFARVSDACFECFSCLVRRLQLFYLDISKVDRWCYACCNVSHLSLLPVAVAVAGASCIEGAGSREAWGSDMNRPRMCVQHALTWASEHTGPSGRPGASAVCDNLENTCI
jgi:hypothetical protein